MYSFGLNTERQLGRMQGAEWDAYPSALSVPLDDTEELAHLAAGENFGAAATDRGWLYVWGTDNRPTTY